MEFFLYCNPYCNKQLLMTSIDDILEQHSPEKPKKSLAEKLNDVRNIVMALAFLIMGLLMVFPEKMNAEIMLQFNETQRFSFGSICILYGCFRIYRSLIAKAV